MNSKSKNIVKKTEPEGSLKIEASSSDLAERNRLEILAGPFVANAMALKAFARPILGGDLDIANLAEALAAAAQKVNLNDLTQVEASLTTQATMLNFMFADLTRRAGMNLSAGTEFVPAAETYFRMALKAQNQARMTLETLSNIKNPPVVYARQANITNGPQQVNNGSNPPSHTTKNNISAKQSFGAK